MTAMPPSVTRRGRLGLSTRQRTTGSTMTRTGSLLKTLKLSTGKLGELRAINMNVVLVVRVMFQLCVDAQTLVSRLGQSGSSMF